MDLKRLDPIEGEDGQKGAFLNSPLGIPKISPRYPKMSQYTRKYLKVLWSRSTWKYLFGNFPIFFSECVPKRVMGLDCYLRTVCLQDHRRVLSYVNLARLLKILNLWNNSSNAREPAKPCENIGKLVSLQYFLKRRKRTPDSPDWSVSRFVKSHQIRQNHQNQLNCRICTVYYVLFGSKLSEDDFARHSFQFQSVPCAGWCEVMDCDGTTNKLHRNGYSYSSQEMMHVGFT